jgi:hypothetical protein
MQPDTKAEAVLVEAKPEPTAKRWSPPVDPLWDSRVIDQIRIEDGILDAAISQRGSDISLVLVVRYSTNVRRARNLGENFVRMAKSLSDDDSPTRSVGQGKYSYLVTVVYPNDRVLAIGGKSKTSNRISW